jgi:hypothetical protein
MLATQPPVEMKGKARRCLGVPDGGRGGVMNPEAHHVPFMEPRLQSLDRRIDRVQARLDRTLDVSAAPIFLLPLLIVLVSILIVGARDATLRRDALHVLAYGLLPLVTFALGWALGRWQRASRREADGQ